ncbi:hypothetical protein BRADI_2g18567v3 [Brachypodium distachyon]|uniref:Uncharacterized protein n=2 Tax=Brachypodium distachyon TaxID=15368 RepID=A0A2K2D952_BRADI|nr:hypothetical protein BRADI_2g18567v3 [Brachypodium distachyon]
MPALAANPDHPLLAMHPHAHSVEHERFIPHMLPPLPPPALSRNPFVLDPDVAGPHEAAVAISPAGPSGGALRRRDSMSSSSSSSPTALSLLLKSTMFRQLVERNDPDYSGAGGLLSGDHSHRVEAEQPAGGQVLLPGEGYEYRDFFHGVSTDACGLLFSSPSSGHGGGVTAAGFQGDAVAACYGDHDDGGERMAATRTTWDGPFADMASL